ncbi:MAG: hypothetical protein ACRDLQ_05400, partial [Solirubrobacterales bacterium]
MLTITTPTAVEDRPEMTLCQPESSNEPPPPPPEPDCCGAGFGAGAGWGAGRLGAGFATRVGA